jgi:hypothetical protein
MKTALLAAGALLALAAPAAAQVSPSVPPAAPSGPTAPAVASGQAGDAVARVAAGPDDVRVNQLIIYGDDTCPPSTDEQINVCAKLPEADRYRIPPNLRGLDDPRSNSWYNRAIELSYVGRTGTDSCSPVGAGGHTGCFNQLVAQARAERAGRDEVNWNRLIEEARQERLSRIDEEAEQVEREAGQPR